MIKRLLLAANLIFLSACATTTFVEHEPFSTQETTGVSVVAAPHGDTIPDSLVQAITEAVEDKLYSEAGYVKTDEMTILFKVMEEDDPLGFWASWWNEKTSGSNKEKLNVGVAYSDVFDTQLAEIGVEVDVGTGRYQVSREEAIESIANEIVDYMQQYFPLNSM